MLLLLCLTFGSMTVYAKEESFGGKMYYCVIDGDDNGIHYSFEGGKTLTMSGSVKIFDTTNYIGTPTTVYVLCYEKTLIGPGNKICSASVLPKYDGKYYSFYDEGETKNTSDKYYVYCYKDGDDGFDVEIKGTLTTN